MKKLLWLALVLPLAACASASAKSPADRPALDVPPPPPRIIEPAAPVEALPEPVPDLPAATPTAPPKPRPQQRDGTRDPAKAEPKQETPAEPPQGPPVPPPPMPPESQLRTPGTADSAEAARHVKEILDRARGLLGTIRFQTLTDERRKAYNESKEFMQGAEDALKKQNYVFARSLAEKAEKLARELQGR